MSVHQFQIVRFEEDDIEAVGIEGIGWVSLGSLLEPFGKRVDHTLPLLDGWARTRVEFVAPRQEGSNDSRAKRVTLVHHEDVPLVLARLDGRGMPPPIKAKHARYLQHVARALAEHFGLRPASAAPLDPWAVLQASARATLELRDRVERTEGVLDEQGRRLEEAAKDAATAKRLAEQAVQLVGSKSVMAAVVDATAPGRATETPDGVFAARARDGFRSMRSVARRFGLPRLDVGANLVAKVTEALGLFARAELFDVQAVTVGGRIKNDHRLYGPKAIEELERPLRAAYAAMIELGYTVTEGGALVAMRHPVRSKTWVVKQMFAAAVEKARTPPSAPADDQQDLFNKAS